MKTLPVITLILAQLAGGALLAQNTTPPPPPPAQTAPAPAPPAAQPPSASPQTDEQARIARVAANAQRQAQMAQMQAASAAAAQAQADAFKARLEALAKLPQLKENMTLTVKAELITGVPVEISLSGVGPEFSNSLALPQPSLEGVEQILMVGFNCLVVPVDDGFRIKYELSYAVVPGSKDAQGNSVVHVQDVASTVVVKLDEPLTDDKPTKAKEADGKFVTLKISRTSPPTATP